MVARLLALIVLIAAIVVLAVVFARPLLGLPAPTASPGPTTAATSASPARSVPPTTAPPSSASPGPTATPTRSPTASCPPVAPGGKAGAFHSLTDVRVAHQPGFDRVVFDFGQESGAADDLPAFRIDRATSFTAISGQPVTLQGSAFWSIRFEPSSIADRSGRITYAGSRDIVPTTPLVKEVKEVEDFEAVMVWGVGLARLECPAVMTLRSPLRLVIDLPAAP